MGKTNVKVAKPKSGLTFFQKVKAFQNIIADVLTGNTVLYSIQLCAIAGYLGCLCEIQLQKWYFWKQVRGVTELRIPGSVR